MALKAGKGLQTWEIAVTKKLVAEFRRRSPSLIREEFEDLVQECLMHWLEASTHAIPDPDGPPIAYLSRVVRNKLIDLVREREADKRRGELNAVSLDGPVGDGDDARTLAELIDIDPVLDPDRQASLTASDLRVDIGKVIEGLTPAQRRLCALFGAEGLSIKAAAERLGIPRGTLYEEIKRIRKVFAAHGLDDYLRD
jgi:RNA polymerase sigma-70 factor (ECF subfamily)